jgi:hypothetical protein
MSQLLLNLVLFSFGFAFLAPRYGERISFRLAIRWACAGVILLLLVGIAGFAFGQSLEKTFFVLGRGNDMQMGVIGGVGALYIALLCCLWSLSILLQKKRSKK